MLPARFRVKETLMARSKLVALARSLTLAASVGAPCLAHAADLLPPPPPPPMAPPPVDVGGGWYLRGDVGVSALRLNKFEGTDRAGFIGPEGGYQREQTEIGDQAFAGAGVGYQFNAWLRGDVTAEYRTSANLSFGESYANCFSGSCEGLTPPFPRGYDFYKGHISTIVAMANGYVDLGTWYGVTPFIGAGIGSAFHRTSTMTDFGAGTALGGIGVIQGRDTTSLAWALHAGLAMNVTPNLKLEVGYRYLNMGTAKTGTLQCFETSICPDTTYKFKDIEAHDVKVGFRYMLGGFAAAPLPPIMPDYQPAPGPLVRKY
jgi:opacity protein-like surface antigen